MELLVRIDGGWLDSRIPDIAARLLERDPLLEVQAVCNTNGAVLGYDIVRHEPNGTDWIVGHWGTHEVDKILPEIAVMDREAHDHVETIARVRKNNDVRSEANRAEFRGWYQEALEHGALLIRDLTEGKHFFGQAGMGESRQTATKPTRQQRRADERRARKAT